MPFLVLGSDEGTAIIQLLRVANAKSLHLLEQARFVDELKSTRGLNVAEIAAQLSRSKAWVSVRLGLIAQMSAVVREQLFAGAFPVYSYMYTVREFMRLNGNATATIDSFVLALSGKKLSTRQIEQLAHGFFRGPESFRAEILQGNIALALKQMDQAPQDPDGCSEFERILLHDLETLDKYPIGSRTPAPTPPRVRRLDPTHPRKTPGATRYPGQILHPDPHPARPGHQPQHRAAV